ncbi:MAG: hypothetical protein H6969_03260 [Gammaproteobacteria bacterium]|nr:hypothetical protein [Gammaproteobacteria bacterium]MCP5459585.1 hypothetical protein [Gammaproteobacteria bacterium]
MVEDSDVRILERREQEQKQLLYVLGHDLREPLRMVVSFTDLLARRYQGKLDAEADEFIAYIRGGSQRLQGMLDDLVMYLRSGNDQPQLQTTDSNVVVREVVQRFHALIQTQDATVSFAAKLPDVQADRRHLSQVFHHLLDNAFKFRGEQPLLIQISAETHGDECVFTVRDNGIGIDPRFSERIFQLFQHLHETEKYPGRGVGLAFSRKIVEQHGGRIWVESQPGQGCAFYFTWPLALAAAGSTQ